MRLHSQVLPDAIVRNTRLPRTLVTTTIRHLKEAGRIPRGYRHAPPLSPRDLARIILGLSAMSPTAAVEHERAVGRLPLAEGDGEATAEDALVAIIRGATPHEEAANGKVLIGQITPIVEIRAGQDSVIYRTRQPRGAQVTFTISTHAIRAMAHALLQDENVQI